MQTQEEVNLDESLTAGDSSEAAELLKQVYAELRKLAASRIAQEDQTSTLQPTALVHDAYLRMMREGTTPCAWDGRAHFFAAAAEAMRRILIDRARKRGTRKNGAGWRQLRLDPNLLTQETVPEELLALDVALEKLAAVNPLRAELVKLRFFASLTLPDAAAVLGISIATAERHWRGARLWLYDELQNLGAGQPSP
jgi:RNA polymerase sigma factor (TIGR02999 family)